MRLDVLTLFPEMFTGVLGSSILKRAATKGHVSYHLHQLRDFSKDPHKKVDDRPFGGGPGMVIMCQPVMDAVAAISAMDTLPATPIILAPTGEKLTQGIAEDLSKLPRLLLIAGHYEGFDERIHEILRPKGCREISIGDYVLSGGELPAMVLVDAVVRLVPGVLGDDQSPHNESFSAGDATINGGLEYPHYTRPREFEGRAVPEILFSGNHGAVEAWRREQARIRTAERRPDLSK
ncbi:MAG TPA: tRNA (guanosine(37)-N1)-methyltransferase TrmD [Phycisphaerae bacterium]|jgi:tRNA (guanine37-N1)-methyltransferase